MVIRLDDHVGLNSSMAGFRQMWEKGQLAVVQGSGTRTPSSRVGSDGHLAGRGPQESGHDGLAGASGKRDEESLGGVPILQVGSKGCRWPCPGASGGEAVTVNDREFVSASTRWRQDVQQKARRRLFDELAAPAAKKSEDDLASFIQRRQVQTLTAVETLRDLLEGPNAVQRPDAGLSQKLSSLPA